MFVVVWERLGGGGHQVALTEDRAERIHRAISRAMPEATCRILPAEDYAAGAVEQRPEHRERRRRAPGRA